MSENLWKIQSRCPGECPWDTERLAAIDQAWCAEAVFSSSGGAIYGEQEMYPAPESHATRPLSPYGISKLCVEQHLSYYQRVNGLQIVSLRYANVYGPRQDPEGEAGVVAIFIQKLLNNEQAIVNGNGRQTRDFVYVEDVVEANLAAMGQIYKGGITLEQEKRLP